MRHVHRKVYLPTYGMFDEQRYFAAATECARSIPRSAAGAADLRGPVASLDDLSRGARRRAVRALPVGQPAARHRRAASQDDNARYWEMINRFYAKTYSLFMVYANRVGFEDGVGFWGGSEIVDPFGERIAKAKYYDEDSSSPSSARMARRKRTMSPLLRDEDIDLTINELMRIRGGRARNVVQAQGFASSQLQSVKKAKVASRRRTRNGPEQIPTNTALLREILIGFIRDEVRKIGVERVWSGLRAASIRPERDARRRGARRGERARRPDAVPDVQPRQPRARRAGRAAPRSSSRCSSTSRRRSTPTSSASRTPTRAGAATRWRASA